MKNSGSIRLLKLEHDKYLFLVRSPYLLHFLKLISNTLVWSWKESLGTILPKQFSKFDMDMAGLVVVLRKLNWKIYPFWSLYPRMIGNGGLEMMVLDDLLPADNMTISFVFFMNILSWRSVFVGFQFFYAQQREILRLSFSDRPILDPDDYSFSSLLLLNDSL